MARESMKKKRADKSNHIIEIATEVFSEKGYHGALTDEIAERAGISKRSMYYYIGDKDMLYEAVMKNLLDVSNEYLYVEPDENTTPEKKIERINSRDGKDSKNAFTSFYCHEGIVFRRRKSSIFLTKRY